MCDTYTEISRTDDSGAGVKVYFIRCEIDGTEYAGELPALSFADANEKAARIGAKVDGRIIADIIPEKICSVCGDSLKIDKTKAEALTEEWPDEI